MAIVRWNDTEAVRRLTGGAQLLAAQVGSGAKTPKPIKATGWKANEKRVGAFLCRVSTTRAGTVEACHVGWWVGATCLVYAIVETEEEARSMADQLLLDHLRQIGEHLCVEAKSAVAT